MERQATSDGRSLSGASVCGSLRNGQLACIPGGGIVLLAHYLTTLGSIGLVQRQARQRKQLELRKWS